MSEVSQEPNGAPEQTDRFDKYTKGGRKIIELARQYAVRSGSSSITPEHVLRGLTVQGSHSATVLQALGVSLEMLQDTAGESTHASKPNPNLPNTEPQIDIDRDTKTVIGYAVDEARRTNSCYLGSEYLLLGVLRQGGRAARILQAAGANLDKAREAVKAAKFPK